MAVAKVAKALYLQWVTGMNARISGLQPHSGVLGLRLGGLSVARPKRGRTGPAGGTAFGLQTALTPLGRVPAGGDGRKKPKKRAF